MFLWLLHIMNMGLFYNEMRLHYFTLDQNCNINSTSTSSPRKEVEGNLDLLTYNVFLRKLIRFECSYRKTNNSISFQFLRSNLKPSSFSGASWITSLFESSNQMQFNWPSYIIKVAYNVEMFTYNVNNVLVYELWVCFVSEFVGQTSRRVTIEY